LRIATRRPAAARQGGFGSGRLMIDYRTQSFQLLRVSCEILVKASSQTLPEALSD
jgi:hypothetical protein